MTKHKIPTFEEFKKEKTTHYEGIIQLFKEKFKHDKFILPNGKEGTLENLLEDGYENKVKALKLLNDHQ